MTLHHPSREQLRLDDVLTALGHPVRLSIVHTLSRQGECMCSAIPVGVSKSTATHHWRVLRESGVIRQQQSGRATLTSLRREDLEARFPGLLGCVLDAYASECADDDRGDDDRGDDRRGDDQPGHERQGESVAGLAAAHRHSVAEPLLEARSG